MSIFQPDNFTNPNISFLEVAAEEKDIIFDVIGLFYAQPKIRNLTKVAATGVNSDNYRIILEKPEGEAVVLLRRHKQLTNRDLINFSLQLMEKLRSVGVKLSAIVKNLQGELSTEYGGNFYTIFEFIEGNHFEPSEKGFLSVAEEVAKLHQAFKTIDQSKRQEIEKMSQRNSEVYFNKIKDYSAADFRDKIQLITDKKERNAVENNLVEEYDFLTKTIEEVQNNKAAIEGLPQAVIHSDLHPHNIIMQGNQVAALLDFDSVRVKQQALEVGFALYRFGRQFLVGSNLTDDGLRKEAVRLKELFIGEYEKTLPLLDEEKKLMPILLKDEFLKKLLFVLREVYDKGKTSWEKDLPKFLAALKEINYFWNQYE